MTVDRHGISWGDDDPQPLIYDDEDAEMGEEDAEVGEEDAEMVENDDEEEEEYHCDDERHENTSGDFIEASRQASGDSDQESSPDDQESSPVSELCDCTNMPDYNENIFGESKVPKAPVFCQRDVASIWQSWEKANIDNMVPVRVEVINIPAELFGANATAYREMVTPSRNTVRAISIASILGLFMAPMSKGIRTGTHSDSHRAGGPTEDGKEQKTPVKCYSYMYVDPDNQHRNLPMMVFGHEEIVSNEDTSIVEAVRVWKFVFDRAHSDSHLISSVMAENHAVSDSSGLAHDSARFRNKTLVAEHKNTMMQMGGLGGGRVLEDHAGTQFTGIKTISDWHKRLGSYGGDENTHSTKDRALFQKDKIPPGHLNAEITGHPTNGGVHILGPEYAFSAFRERALTAGLFRLSTGQDMNPHIEQTKTANYFDEHGVFKVPKVSESRFFFCTDPHMRNLFDAPFPRPLIGLVEPGNALIELYTKYIYDPEFERGQTKARVKDHFHYRMTENDATERLAQEAIKQVNFDDFNLSESDRKRGFRSYGLVDSKERLIMEPDQPLRTVARNSRRISDTVIAPSMQKEQSVVNSIRRGEDDIAHASGTELPSEIAQREFNTKNFHVMRDFIHLHIGRMDEAFKGEANREEIAGGHIAAYDGLMEAVSINNGSASIAWEQGVRLAGNDTSSFAQTLLWVGQFFELDAKIDGRDYHLMFELFFTCFEPFADVTFLSLLCGTKGNGKTKRSTSLKEAFPRGWVQESGDSSAKAGMNGQNEDGNGRVKIYDEMISDLIDDSVSGERLELWKQMLMNRMVTYTRTVALKTSDGCEVHKTIKICTPHEESHIMCTNWGPAFTKNGEPNDTKTAMLDRTVSMHVRSNGRNTSSETDFKLHLQSAQGRAKLQRFRLFVSLVGITRLFIRGVPCLQPDLALAYRILDYLDDSVIVKEYNLTPPTPRKAMKRIENLITMCCMKAVADVFMYQQTSVNFDAGRPTKDGRGQPFHITQLYDVIRQLRATPEMIFMAFSQGLDHSIGTSYSGFSVMTALCEHLGLAVGDWLKKPVVSQEPEPSAASTPSITGESLFASNVAAQADREQERARQAQQLQQSRAAQTHNLSQLANLVTLEGMTVNERDQVLQSLQRSRRMTSAYRLLCGQNGNSELRMYNPIDTIEHVMRGAEKPPDFVAPVGGSGSQHDYLPFFSSSIMAGILQVNMFYTAENVAKWCADSPVTTGVDNLSLGTSYSLKFSESHRSGPSEYNYAWLQATNKRGHRGVATEMITHNSTVANFDIGINVLRDTLWLLSTSDNTRRCTERPKLAEMIHESKAFTDVNGKEFESTFGLSSAEAKTKDGEGGIKIRGAVDCRNRAAQEQNPGAQTKSRHPFAGVPDSDIQRKLDLLVQGGRFPALMSSVSNKVSKCAPIRLVYKGEFQYLEANTASCVDHTRNLAEAIIRGSLQPGMEGMQETLCGNSSAPAGLNAVAASDSGGASEVPPTDAGRCRVLPYSMDILGISISLDVLQRLYDPQAEDKCVEFSKRCAEVGLDLTFDAKSSIPHTSLRFVGLDHKAESRKLLSVPVRTTQNPSFAAVNVEGDDNTCEDIMEMIPNLKLSLGHEPDDDDINEFMKACKGSRAMPGIKGDLMSCDTYRTFQLTTMTRRGMIDDEQHHDPVLKAVSDDGHDLILRVVERVSEEINGIVNKHPKMKAAMRVTDEDRGLEEAARIEAVAARVRKTRVDLYYDRELALPSYLEGMRHYAHVRVETPSKLTYHNKNVEMDRNRDKAYNHKRSHDSVGPPVVRSSAVQKTAAASMFATGVRARGVRDSRLII